MEASLEMNSREPCSRSLVETTSKVCTFVVVCFECMPPRLLVENLHS
jgi:hypothetical protein